jgi:3'-5' exonuclease
MNRVVFDIETLGYPLESFDVQQQGYLTKFAHTEEELTDVIQKLNLTPFTAQIIAIGMLNPDTHSGRVFYQAPPFRPGEQAPGVREAGAQTPGRIASESLPGNAPVEFLPLTEEEMLQEFWKAIVHYDQFITFNGRAFDCPFILLRSALRGIKPLRNLMPYRWSHTEHCDLLEQLTFYGATRKFSLDFYCKSFGIPSPKERGITGLDMGRLFAEGRYREIAEYCLGDIIATAVLFQRWQSMLVFDKQ